MLCLSVISGKSVDSALDKNESEFSVLILSVLLHVLSHVDGLLDEMVEVLGDLGSESVLLQDSEDLIACHSLDLGDTVVVSEHNTDLGGGAALLGELHDLLHEVVGGDLHPTRRSGSEGEASSCDTFAV